MESDSSCYVYVGARPDEKQTFLFLMRTECTKMSLIRPTGMAEVSVDGVYGLGRCKKPTEAMQNKWEQRSWRKWSSKFLFQQVPTIMRNTQPSASAAHERAVLETPKTPGKYGAIQTLFECSV